MSSVEMGSTSPEILVKEHPQTAEGVFIGASEQVTELFAAETDQSLITRARTIGQFTIGQLVDTVGHLRQNVEEFRAKSPDDRMNALLSWLGSHSLI